MTRRDRVGIVETIRPLPYDPQAIWTRWRHEWPTGIDVVCATNMNVKATFCYQNSTMFGFQQQNSFMNEFQATTSPSVSPIRAVGCYPFLRCLALWGVWLVFMFWWVLDMIMRWHWGGWSLCVVLDNEVLGKMFECLVVVAGRRGLFCLQKAALFGQPWAECLWGLAPLAQKKRSPTRDSLAVTAKKVINAGNPFDEFSASVVYADYTSSVMLWHWAVRLSLGCAKPGTLAQRSSATSALQQLLAVPGQWWEAGTLRPLGNEVILCYQLPVGLRRRRAAHFEASHRRSRLPVPWRLVAPFGTKLNVRSFSIIVHLHDGLSSAGMATSGRGGMFNDHIYVSSST